MSESYELHTIQDIFDKVPADRIPDCCRELGQALASTAMLRDLAVACGAQVVGIEWPMVWRDDDKGEITSVLHARDGNGEDREILRVDFGNAE